MTSSQSNEQVLGGFAAAGAYTLWGIMPVYWKLIHGATAEEVLSHRIIWSFVFMIIVLMVTRHLQRLIQDIKELMATPKRLYIIIGAAFTITINWYIFIWSVSHGHVVQASLGYYINPLISVLLGIVFLKERLSMWQIISFVLALIGVLIMTIQAGVFPWISILLALSFGLYGLLKKVVKLRAMTGLTIETAIVTPIALMYLWLFDPTAGRSFSLANPSLTFLLIGAGIVTAVPLLLFATGANRISLAMVGFFQYIAPTLMLLLGTLVYHEPFDQSHLISFILIWVSLIIFSLARTKWFMTGEQKLLRRKVS